MQLQKSNYYEAIQKRVDSQVLDLYYECINDLRGTVPKLKYLSFAESSYRDNLKIGCKLCDYLKYRIDLTPNTKLLPDYFIDIYHENKFIATGRSLQQRQLNTLHTHKTHYQTSPLHDPLGIQNLDYNNQPPKPKIEKLIFFDTDHQFSIYDFRNYPHSSVNKMFSADTKTKGALVFFGLNHLDGYMEKSLHNLLTSICMGLKKYAETKYSSTFSFAKISSKTKNHYSMNDKRPNLLYLWVNNYNSNISHLRIHTLIVLDHNSLINDPIVNEVYNRDYNYSDNGKKIKGKYPNYMNIFNYSLVCTGDSIQLDSMRNYSYIYYNLTSDVEQLQQIKEYILERKARILYQARKQKEHYSMKQMKNKYI